MPPHPCAHCGRIRTGCGHVRGYPVCHTGDPRKPDCYRRITVYDEPIGILKDVPPAELPGQVEDIRRWP